MNNGYVIDGEFSVVVGVPIEEHSTYQGAYEFTPTEETQTAETADKIMDDDITIHPIPEDYIKTDDADALASDIASGKTAYVNGEKLEGTNTFDSDTKQDTATAGDVLFGKTAHSQGALLVGTMPDNAAEYGFIVDKSDEIEIHKGFHNGNGKVQLDPAMKDRIIPENIKPGVNILGVDGSYTTDATASPADITKGKTAYAGGQKITGTSDKDSDTSQDTATAADLLEGTTAHSQGQALTGTMTNHGQKTATITDKSEAVMIPEGYHNGQGYVQIDDTEKAKLIAGNIKAGADILGVTGDFTSDADAVAGDILEGKTAYKDGQKLTGTMIERGTPTITIARKDSVGTINEGHYSGGSLVIVKSERDKIIPENIKAGADILGVTGTYTNDADATAEDIASGKTAYVNGQKLTGTAAGDDQTAALVSRALPFDYDLTGIEKIANFCFASYFSDGTNTYTVNAPDVTEIGIQAFANSDGISKLTLGDGPITIAQYAFKYTDNLETIENLENVSSIGQSAFDNSGIRGTVKVGADTFGNTAFLGCKNIEKLIYSGTAISGTAFQAIGLNKAPVIYITNPNIQGIASNAFNYCTTVTDVYVPFSDTDRRANGAPWGCTNATIHYNTVFDEDGEPII